ncbi:uncharacterized protein TM35_000153000 [Trypanosoma theileri]|uniref:Uncharacterized protein n=1 Tax=Trypanosoma theileri TaxID=67003 RepID=A0A1X0NXC1_9TRYP|nr:uncharacterized protein TM35_000153000 [Trypanosoma theileri]ORC88869.1 hypothetical protein TM35_000153000 [Trypanosoma theileri]
MQEKKGRQKSSRKERGSSETPIKTDSSRSRNESSATRSDSIETAVKPIQKEKKKTEQKKSGNRLYFNKIRFCHTVGFICAVVVAIVFFYFFNEDLNQSFPCHCCTSTEPLVSAFSTKRFGLTGIHLQRMNSALVEKQLSTLPKCVTLHRLTTPFDSVTSFLQRLKRDAAANRCVLWFVEDVGVVRGVGNSLKELFEDNALRGEPVLPRGSRGLFVVNSEKSREELKDILPHRVVHMLHTIKV